MIKNFFFLNRFIVEADKLLSGYKLVSAFSQEKDKLVFRFISGENEKYLEACVNPGFPYLSIHDNFHRAKKNTADFFNDILPSSLVSFNIAEEDRIVKIIFEEFSIYFTVRGKNTNVLLIDKNSKISAFKKIEKHDSVAFINEIKSINFVDFYILPDFNFNTDQFTPDNFRKKYPFVGKEIIKEANFRRSNSSAPEFILTVKNIITEIAAKKPAVFIDDDLAETALAVETFHVFPFKNIYKFDDMISAVNFYLGKKYFVESASSKRKTIEKKLNREIEKITSKMNNLKGRISRGTKEEELNKIGNLLLINLHSIKTGMGYIEIEDIYDNNKPIRIELNKKLSPRKNVDAYFDKSKSERIEYEKAHNLYEGLKNEFDKYKSLKEKLNEAESLKDYNKLMKEMNIKNSSGPKSKDDIRDKFKHYIIEGKYNVYVGKDSSNNDLLTTKFAKQNDFWFHARSLPGSHVVLKVENTKEAVPKNILKKAASLAAFHSKAKTAGVAPVSYTMKKYVIKRKGMAPGKVALLKEEVLLVKPEIPKDCEYISND